MKKKFFALASCTLALFVMFTTTTANATQNGSTEALNQPTAICPDVGTMVNNVATANITDNTLVIGGGTVVNQAAVQNQAANPESVTRDARCSETFFFNLSNHQAYITRVEIDQYTDLARIENSQSDGTTFNTAENNSLLSRYYSAQERIETGINNAIVADHIQTAAVKTSADVNFARVATRIRYSTV